NAFTTSSRVLIARGSTGQGPRPSRASSGPLLVPSCTFRSQTTRMTTRAMMPSTITGVHEPAKLRPPNPPPPEPPLGRGRGLDPPPPNKSGDAPPPEEPPPEDPPPPNQLPTLGNSNCGSRQLPPSPPRKSPNDPLPSPLRIRSQMLLPRPSLRSRSSP